MKYCLYVYLLNLFCVCVWGGRDDKKANWEFC